MNKERKRLATDLRRYFEDGPSTFRTLLEYLHIDYATGMEEGWLDFNNSIVEYEDRIGSGETPAPRAMPDDRDRRNA
jgi:hypothetical protein